MIYCFDVFDTILTRTCFKSTDLFEGLSLVLLKEEIIYDTSNFRANRTIAEVNARASSPNEEITLHEIYAELSKQYGWTTERMEYAQELEVRLESSSIRPIGEMVDEINSKIKNGDKVCFASDIYLPQEFINTMLLVIGVHEGYELFVSSAHLKTKHHASLYRTIAKHYNVQITDMVHVGDNRHSDYHIPRRLGIDARWYKNSMPTRYEQALYDSTIGNVYLRSLLAGSMKSARLTTFFKDLRLSVISDTGANVVGPMLLMYVLWVLQSAKSKQIESLYFVARDGQVLLAIAKVIQKYFREFQDIDCRYLYGSRQAWHLPSIVRISDDEINWIFDNTFFLSVNSICQRVEISANDIVASLKRAGFTDDCWNDNLVAEQRISLAHLFRTDDEVKALITNHAAAKRAVLVKYLQQEQFFDGRKIAIVDIGWRGRLQASLSKVIQASTIDSSIKPVLNGFYWGLFSDDAQHRSNGNFFAFLKQPASYRETDFLTDYAAILEIFVAASHGSCIGYCQQDGIYKPVLREEINSKLVDWGLLVQQRAVVRFSEDFCSSIDEASLKNINYGVQLSVNALLFSMFGKTPSKHEADAYGGLRMYEDQTENISYELAPMATKINPVIVHNHNIWQEGCKVRNRFPVYQFYRASYYARKVRLKLTKVFYQ